MPDPLMRQLQHFAGSQRQSLLAARDALVRGDLPAFKAVVAQVAELKTTASIANTLNSSAEALRGFLNSVSEQLGSDAMKFLGGTILAGMGRAALIDVVGLAAVLGVSALTVEVVAIGLLLWGIAMALPALWRMAVDRIRDVRLVE